MEISEELEDKMIIELLLNTNISGEKIKRIIGNVKESKTIKEAECLVILGIFFSRIIEKNYAMDKLGYWDESELKDLKNFIKNEDFRCKDDITQLCNINCIWFRQCFNCKEPLCQLHDDWVDMDDDFIHREEYEVLFKEN